MMVEPSAYVILLAELGCRLLEYKDDQHKYILMTLQKMIEYVIHIASFGSRILENIGK